MKSSVHPAFEREALAKALRGVAAAGDWAKAEKLVDKLGLAEWGRRGLMGDSAEEAGFKACLAGLGMPGGQWLCAHRGSADNFNRLMNIAKGAFAGSVSKKKSGGKEKGALPKGASDALAWLAWSAPKGCQVSAFEVWPQEDGQEVESGLLGVDVGPWGRAMAQRAREGSLEGAWRKSPGLWALAGLLEPGPSDEFAKACSESRLLPTLGAARLGAKEVSRWAIDRLEPAQAMGCLAATLSKGSLWGSLMRAVGGEEDADPQSKEGSIEQQWRQWAWEGAGQPGDGFDSLDVGSDWSEVHSRGEIGEQAQRWAQALALVALKAAPALAASEMAHARTWILAHAPGPLRQALDPDFALAWDPSGLSAVDVVMEMEKMLEGSMELPTQSARAAARALWALEEKGSGSLGKDRENLIAKAALALWRGSSALAFEAFASELTRLVGSQGAAARLCEFPSPAFYHEASSQPGSPGHAVALARAFPVGIKDADGREVWPKGKGATTGEALAGWMWDRFASSAQWSMAMCKAESPKGSESSVQDPLPPLPPLGQWGGIDLASPPWKAGQGAARVVQAWELGLDAVGAIVAAIGAPTQSTRPPSPGIGRMGSQRPTMRAWTRHALAHPDDAAKWAALHLTRSDSESKMAEALGMLAGVDEQAKQVLAQVMPRAFEEALVERSFQVRSLASLADACRDAAKALATGGSEPYAQDEVLCAALMCAAAYGCSRGASGLDGNRLDSASSKQMAAMEHGLISVLPQAAEALMVAGFDGGALGFSGADLAAKGAMAELGLASMRDPHGTASCWQQRWGSVRLEASNLWTKACLSAIFTPMALENAGGAGASALVSAASSWLAGFDADGLGRLPGELSALELAVDCRAAGERKINEGGGCFGAEAVDRLVKLGAHPSDPQSPDGLDALALCAQVERKSSPSSVAKALMKSSLIQPGRGDLLGRIASGKSTLSDKLIDQLGTEAMANIEMGALANLAARSGESLGAKHWLGKVLAGSEKARHLASDGLLAALSSRKSAGVFCAKTAETMAEHGVTPSEFDREELLLKGIVPQLGRLLSGKPVAFSSKPWCTAGVKKSPVDPALIGEEVALACVRQGIEGPVWLADATMAHALQLMEESKENVVSVKIVKAAMELEASGFGSPLLSNLATRLLSLAQTSSVKTDLSVLMGQQDYAKLEMLALRSIGSISTPTSTPSRRL